MSGDKSWWAVCKSMNTGLSLLLTIIIASIIGTIIPQKQMIGQQSCWETIYQWSNVYFLVVYLLAFLTMNPAVCSFYRLKTALSISGRLDPNMKLLAD